MNEHTQLFGLLLVAVGVLVGDRQSEAVDQFFDCGIDRSGVGEFREGDEADVKEWFIAGDGKIDHIEHALGSMMNFIARAGVGRVELAGGGVVGGHSHGL